MTITIAHIYDFQRTAAQNDAVSTCMNKALYCICACDSIPVIHKQLMRPRLDTAQWVALCNTFIGCLCIDCTT